MTAWQEIYAARWGKRLDQVEVEAWDDEIMAEVPNVKQPEISAAIRTLAHDERRIGRGKYPVTCNVVIGRIIQMRAEARQANEPPGATGCALCHFGWVSFVPRVVKGNIVAGVLPETMKQVGLMDTPCDCPAGKKALEKYKELANVITPTPSFFAIREAAIHEARRRLSIDNIGRGVEIEEVVFRG